MGKLLKDNIKLQTENEIQCCASGSGSKIICKLGSGSVINSGSDSGFGSGFESGSKLSSASN